MVVPIREEVQYIFFKQKGKRIVTDIPDHIRRLHRDEVKSILHDMSESANTEELKAIMVDTLVSNSGISLQLILKVKL